MVVLIERARAHVFLLGSGFRPFRVVFYFLVRSLSSSSFDSFSSSFDSFPTSFACSSSSSFASSSSCFSFPPSAPAQQARRATYSKSNIPDGSMCFRLSRLPMA